MQAVSNARRISRFLQSPIFLSLHLRTTEQPVLSGFAQRNYNSEVDNVEATPTGSSIIRLTVNSFFEFHFVMFIDL
jgi:hypothetical protein